MERRNMYLISVIIPCYNVSDSVEKCLKALENQTYKNFEVILVDDASTDNTYSYLLDYRRNSSLEIEVIRKKKNAGPGAARNTGLSCAKGEYICFCDSDDWYDKNFIKRMKDAVQEDIDIAMCNIVLIKDNDTKIKYTKISSDIIKSQKDFIVFNDGSLCNLIIKKELFNKIEFPEIYHGEDMAIVPLLFSEAKKIKHIDDNLYYYYVNNHSLSNTVSRMQCSDLINAFEYLYDHMDYVYFNEIEYNYIKMVLYGYTLNAFKAGVQLMEIRKALEKYKDVFKDWEKNIYLSRTDLKKQIYLWMIKKRFWFANKIYAKLHELLLRG